MEQPIIPHGKMGHRRQLFLFFIFVPIDVHLSVSRLLLIDQTQSVTRTEPPQTDQHQGLQNCADGNNNKNKTKNEQNKTNNNNNNNKQTKQKRKKKKKERKKYIYNNYAFWVCNAVDLQCQKWIPAILQPQFSTHISARYTPTMYRRQSRHCRTVSDHGGGVGENGDKIHYRGMNLGVGTAMLIDITY